MRLGNAQFVGNEHAVQIFADAARADPALLRGGRAVGDHVYFAAFFQFGKKSVGAVQQITSRTEFAEIDPVHRPRVRSNALFGEKTLEPLDAQLRFRERAALVFAPYGIVVFFKSE